MPAIEAIVDETVSDLNQICRPFQTRWSISYKFRSQYVVFTGAQNHLKFASLTNHFNINVIYHVPLYARI